MRTIRLNKFKGLPAYALVDDEDFEKVNRHNWSVHKSKNRILQYASCYINGKCVKMHNFIMGIKYIDHINNNGFDNRKSNLRAVSIAQNTMNRKPNAKSTSIYKGVCRVRDKWRAQIQVNKQKKHIGYYKSEIEAMEAYNIKARELFGEYAYINEPIFL